MLCGVIYTKFLYHDWGLSCHGTQQAVPAPRLERPEKTPKLEINTYGVLGSGFGLMDTRRGEGSFAVLYIHIYDSVETGP